ncbi:MAG: hypothetical protein Q7S71_03365 [Candidatus Nitrotoga sp.]|nr:hypothetical protein [Candidatus Nitrotoga sp.]
MNTIIISPGKFSDNYFHMVNAELTGAPFLRVRVENHIQPCPERYSRCIKFLTITMKQDKRQTSECNLSAQNSNVPFLPNRNIPLSLR